MQLFILDTFGGRWPGGDASGGSIVSLAIAKEWARQGNDVHYLSNSLDSLSANEAEGVHVEMGFHAGGRGRESRIGFVAAAVLPSIRQFKEVDSYIRSKLITPSNALLIAGSPYPSDVLLAVTASHRLGIRGVVYVHHLSPPPWWHPSRRGGVVRTTVNWGLALLALTLIKIGRMLPIVFQAQPVAISHWNFDYGVLREEGFIPDRPASYPRTDDASRDIEACFISRIAENKGVLDLLHVWKLVVRQIPTARLIIAGRIQSEDYGQAVQRLRSELGLQGTVSLMSYLTVAEKRALLQRARLFVFPSYEEGWSLSVIEAAGYGAVPIVYDLPAYSYLGSSAVKVSVSRTAEMAAAVVELLLDNRKRDSIAQDLQARVERFTLEKSAMTQLEALARFLLFGRLDLSGKATGSGNE